MKYTFAESRLNFTSNLMRISVHTSYIMTADSSKVANWPTEPYQWCNGVILMKTVT